MKIICYCAKCDEIIRFEGPYILNKEHMDRMYGHLDKTGKRCYDFGTSELKPNGFHNEYCQRFSVVNFS